MASGSSPGTSEITRVTTFAGAAAKASRPPLMAESLRRTWFITEIGTISSLVHEDYLLGGS